MNEHVIVLQAYLHGEIFSNGQLFRAVKWAVDQLKVQRVDNGDGTVTIHGIPVTVPSTLIPDDETPIEAKGRSLPISGRWIDSCGRIRSDSLNEPLNFHGELRIILALKPEPITWTPPASLPDGEYQTRDGWLYNSNGDCICKLTHGETSYADWVHLPRYGRYRKSGNVATWIGE